MSFKKILGGKAGLAEIRASLGDLSRRWATTRDRGTALLLYRASGQVPTHEWSTGAVLGLYVAKWEEHMDAEMNPVMFGNVLPHVESLVGARGAEETVRGIRALFHPSMAWVQGKDIGFLHAPERWDRHVVPVIAAMKVAGEQSEARRTDRTPGWRRVT